MKKIIETLFLVLSILTVQNFVGQGLTPKEAKIQYQKEYIDCYTVTVTPDATTLKKAFKSYVKDQYDVKFKGIGMFSNKDVLYAEEVSIARVSSKRINLYVSIIESKGESELKFFGRYSKSSYFGTKEFTTEFSALKGILIDFLNYYLPFYYKDNLKTATNIYQDLTDEDLDLGTKINDNKEKIKKLQQENISLAEKQEINKQRIIQSKEELIKRQSQLDSIRKQLLLINNE